MTDGISRLENRPNLSIATLKNYIEAMGGELQLVAKFPDSELIVLTDSSELKAKN